MNSSTTHSILKRDWKQIYSHKSQMTRQSTVRFAFSTRHKSKSERHIEIKLILLTKGMRVQGREIKFGDKKWSKKEIANKYINKTASVSRDTHKRGNRENKKTKQKISSQKCRRRDLGFAILRAIHIGRECMFCYEVNV